LFIYFRSPIKTLDSPTFGCSVLDVLYVEVTATLNFKTSSMTT